MAAHVDINKSHEVANEVRRINKQLKECQDLAAVYNNRERLFGMPVTNVSGLADANTFLRSVCVCVCVCLGVCLLFRCVCVCV